MPLDCEKIELSLENIGIITNFIKINIFRINWDKKKKNRFYEKKSGKLSIKKTRNLSSKARNKQEEDENSTDIGDSDGFLKQMHPSLLPIELVKMLISKVYTFVEPIYHDLVGASSEPDPTGCESFMDTHDEELKSWKQHPLRGLEPSKNNETWVFILKV